MKKNQLVGGAVSLLVGCLVVGCGPEIDESDEFAAVEEIDETLEKADGAQYPVGTYELSQGAASPGFERIVLMTNKTFHTEQRVACAVAPCPPVSKNGKYKFGRVGARKYLRLYDTAVRLTQTFEYRVEANETLALWRSSRSPWATFKKAQVAWCAKTSDCKAQRLYSVLTCQGQWRCEPANVCAFQCGR